MNGKIMIAAPIAFMLFFNVTILVEDSSASKQATNMDNSSQEPERPESREIFILERDTLQSRNLMPVINHTTLVANVSSRVADMVIYSSVPAQMDKSGPFWPRFGRNSRLSIPLLPEGLPELPRIDGYEDLGVPQKITNLHPGYRWQFTLAPNQAAVAQYDNYYGPADRFTRGPGELQALGLRISSHYQAIQMGNDITMTMTIDISNAGEHMIEDLVLKFCFPQEIVDLKARRIVRLLDMVSYKLSPNAIYTEVGHADGFGHRVALGHAATFARKKFAPNQTARIVFEIQGKRTLKVGEVYPAYFVKFKELNTERIWPKSKLIVRGKPTTVKRHYYRESDLLIPASWCFLLVDGGVDVVDPRDVKPTHPLPLPRR